MSVCYWYFYKLEFIQTRTHRTLSQQDFENCLDFVNSIHILICMPDELYKDKIQTYRFI